jgi:starch phosphorylase
MKEEVGDENIFIFGLTAEDVALVREHGYDPMKEINSSPALAQVIRMIADGVFSPDDHGLFRPILDALVSRDWFLVLKDFASYVACQERVSQLWRDPEKWSRMSILNSAGMGKFSSDRCAMEYAREIWNVVPTPITVG